jgi:cytosine/uracil/thiamine/allantoin permease
MLHAIFPSIKNLPNPFGPDVTMTGGRLIGFVIGWVATLASTYFEIHKFKKLIIVKAVIMMACLIAFFGWAIHLAGGVGPVSDIRKRKLLSIHHPDTVRFEDFSLHKCNPVLDDILQRF